MISCKEAAELISEELEQDLPALKRVALKVHLAICKTCVCYQRQIHELSKVFGHYSDSIDKTNTSSDEDLSEESRQRIKTALKDKKEN